MKMLLSVVFTSIVAFVHLFRKTTGQLSLIYNVKIQDSGLIDGSLELCSRNLVCEFIDNDGVKFRFVLYRVLIMEDVDDGARGFRNFFVTINTC